VLDKHGYPLASNQVEYHLLDRRIERSGLLANCLAGGVRVIAYSPLAKGMLTGKYAPGNPPPGPRGRKYAPVLKEIQQLVGVLTEIGLAHGAKSPAQVALNWVLCKGALPIPGAKTLAQAQENLGALGWRLTAAEVAALDEASELFAH
jgi:aryl-alcohol dehydrogenase-like predicted oxidoreductase